MSNPNPVHARQAKRRKRRGQPGTLEDARTLLWRALSRAGDLLDAETVSEDGAVRLDNVMALKAIHAISQGAAAYARIVEVGELQERLEEMEASMTALQKGESRVSRGAA